MSALKTVTGATSAINYVYFHIDPEENGLIVYVGRGTRERAWRFGNAGGTSPAYGHRSREHWLWYLSKEAQGFLPGDLAQIIARQLYVEEAIKLEGDLIQKHNPRFNCAQGLRLLKFTPETLKAAVKLRHAGLSYSQIAKEIGLSTMTVYRALNGLTKNIRND